MSLRFTEKGADWGISWAWMGDLGVDRGGSLELCFDSSEGSGAKSKQPSPPREA